MCSLKGFIYVNTWRIILTPRNKLQTCTYWLKNTFAFILYYLPVSMHFFPLRTPWHTHTNKEVSAVVDCGTCSMQAPVGFAHVLPDCTPGGLPDCLSAHELNCVLASLWPFKPLPREWSLIILKNESKTTENHGLLWFIFFFKHGGCTSI